MLSSYCYKHFVLVGAHPHHPTSRFRFIFNVSLVMCLLVLVSYKAYHDKDLKVVESLSLLLIVNVKYLILVLEKTKIKRLVDAMKHFWKSHVGDDQVTFFLSHLKRVEDFYKFIFICGPIVFAVEPLVTKRSSIFNAYIPPHIPFQLLYTVEIYVLVFGTATFICFNLLMSSLIVLTAVQFRLLNLKIKDIDFASVENGLDLARARRDLYTIIRYQQFLIRYIMDLNELLSAPLALLIASNVTVFCINMYILTTSHNLTGTCRIVITTCALVFEYFMVFGLPAQLLMDEATSTADFVYQECEWYLPALKPLRSDFLIMIMRSQRKNCIRAGNYHIISNQTVLLMLKTAYTFYAFIQNVT